ncbi:glycoside hydrolase family 27 protein [Asticcacaulis sp. 201]|uniref:glycoside hydrolase family 27 protein n=1 Tax=Asticcacaulis sp. 201 TaxID=3028787 RepID=UPI00291638D0|nr:glycoside hydrolase family 27 protein [Asticcacaulis sp. 201]MDV6330160.1 glycoside hydrolase family 27 protein [Asticcacaulis sp. 201]
MKVKDAIVAIAAVLLMPVLLGGQAQAHETLQLDAPKPPLALTPPMGWNSWNKFACNIDEGKIRAVADAMAASGMKEAGYQYVVIDDCWQKDRAADGTIQADPERFPSGIKALADYIHSKGLKFGIYSDAGVKTCGGRPGSAGYEFQDARTYAAWGVDYLKYDWCNTGTRNAEAAYTLMAKALRQSGRDILLSICEWGDNKPREWAAKPGHQWRTTGDIRDSWDKDEGYSHSFLWILDSNADLWMDSGPNHWNDPDMLEVGNGGMTDTEYRSHFSLWAMLAAPLIAGNDLSNMSPETLAILTNHDVIAIDQDPLGQQGRRLVKDGDFEVWVRPLKGGDRAVVLFNRSGAAKTMAVDWETLQLPAGTKASVRDLWSKAVKKNVKGSYAAEVPSHGVVMVRITPTV